MDFTFLANIVEDANCFYVRADSPIRSVQDLVEQARARPGRITYGTTGVGSDDHIFVLAFEALAGIPPMVHVPYAGAAPLILQLTGGHMDVAAVNVNDAIGLAREGKLRMLAQAAARRQPEAPDVPTFRELGLDLVHGASRGVVGPPGLPAEITGRPGAPSPPPWPTRASGARRSAAPCRSGHWWVRPTARWRPGWTRSSESSGRSAPGGAERNAISHGPGDADAARRGLSGDA